MLATTLNPRLESLYVFVAVNVKETKTEKSVFVFLGGGWGCVRK